MPKQRPMSVNSVLMLKKNKKLIHHLNFIKEEENSGLYNLTSENLNNFRDRKKYNMLCENPGYDYSEIIYCLDSFTSKILNRNRNPNENCMTR